MGSGGRLRDLLPCVCAPVLVWVSRYELPGKSKIQMGGTAHPRPAPGRPAMCVCICVWASGPAGSCVQVPPTGETVIKGVDTGLTGYHLSPATGGFHTVHMYVHMYVCIYMFIYIHTYIHTYTYIYTYIYTYMHAYIHTYIYVFPINRPSWSSAGDGIRMKPLVLFAFVWKLSVPVSVDQCGWCVARYICIEYTYMAYACSALLPHGHVGMELWQLHLCQVAGFGLLLINICFSNIKYGPKFARRGK